MSLKNKVVIVTGGNSGIGQAIALELARQEASIVIDYVVHPEATEELERQVSKLGGQSIGVVADVSNCADLQKLEHELRKKLKELREHIVKNADYVGPRFPEQARKIHYGEVEHRSIYGEATPEEAEELHEEGIAFAPLPVLPDEFN